MTPETKLEMFYRSCLAALLTLLALPLIGLWAAASGVEKMIKRKGG